MEILNNREIATLIWLAIITILGLSNKSIRESAKGVVKAFFQPVILAVVIVMLIYEGIITIPLFAIGLWFNLLYKELFIWVVGTGLVIVMNISKAKDWKFFRNIVIEAVGLSVAIEFLIQQYSFSILVELIFLPVVVFIVMMSAVAGTRKDAHMVKKLFDFILSIIGFILLGRVIYFLVTDIGNFTTYENLMSFLLPIVLTIAFIPFIYLLAIFINYDSLLGKHGRLRHVMSRNDNDLFPYVLKKIMITCNLNLSRWWKFDPEFANKLFNPKTKEAVDEVMESFTQSLSEH